MKKIERGANYVAENLELFSCPVCQSRFEHVELRSVFCEQNHQFDLSKKGTLYLLKHGVTSDYDDDRLWQARRKCLQAGLFDPIISELQAKIPAKGQKILDIGCGEGTPLQRLEHLRTEPNDRYLGFDISKRAINLATQQETNAFFCIADLAALPFATEAFDQLIDIFSPSAYQEFSRVLKPGGQLLKVIPNADYLGELRRALYPKETKNHAYSNASVVALFEKHFPKMEKQRIKYHFALDPELFSALLQMTPLQWGASKERRAQVLSEPLDQITVDVTLLCAQK